MSAHSLSRVWLFVAPWTVAGRAPLPMEFSRQEYIIPYVSVVFLFPLLFLKKHLWFADRLKLKDWFQKIDKDPGWGFWAPMEPLEVWVTVASLENSCGAPAKGNKPKKTLGTVHWVHWVSPLQVIHLWLFENMVTDFFDTPLSKRCMLISTFSSANCT